MRKNVDSLMDPGEEEDKLDRASSGHSSANALLNIDTSNNGSEKLTTKEIEVIETPRVLADVPKYTCTSKPSLIKCTLTYYAFSPNFYHSFLPFLSFQCCVVFVYGTSLLCSQLQMSISK